MSPSEAPSSQPPPAGGGVKGKVARSPPPLAGGGWEEGEQRHNDERILVLKLGALGDFVMAMGPAAAIREHHPGAHITLLTTKAFAALGDAAPYFDTVWIDERPSLLSSPLGTWRLRRRLRAGGFDRVYDLQTSDRSSFYFQLMAPGLRPEWSGIAQGCSHPHANPLRDFLHTIERQRDQLAFAGIDDVPFTDLSWLSGDLSRFNLPPRPLVLLVPGGSPHRPEKRWPGRQFAELANVISAQGAQPIIIGGSAEISLARHIAEQAQGVLDLVNKTSFAQIASLARRASHAVGNDTGPMHLIAAAGCPLTVLFSDASDPNITQPRTAPGAAPVFVLRRQRLADLSVAEVAATLPPR